ncbi:class I adenylate-forming enzyme family protein [Paenibacillus sp. GCM10027628]|uniref:class I adenylate-forming enzyme family protein n=1 Tax=Paenibacillus sp. GCM10027628 TaxID=3273413 RepID=UPI003643322B
MNSLTLSDFFQETAREDRGCLFVHASTNEERWISYLDMYRQACDRSRQLCSFTIRKRFIAAIWMEQSSEWLVAFMSIVLAGGIPIPLHQSAKAEDIVDLIESVEAEVVMLSSPQALKLNHVLEDKPHGKSALGNVLLIDGETGEMLHSPMRTSTLDRIRRYIPPSETAVIFMSSGSTGSPKGIMLSEKNLLSNLHAIQDYLQIAESDRVWLSKSLGYSSTITGEWFLSLYTGAHLYMSAGSFHPLYSVKFIRDYGITFMCAVPSMLIPLVKSTKWKPSDLCDMKKMIIVGAQMPAAMLIQLIERLPWVQIMPGYGLTEASPRVSYLPYQAIRNKANSAGIPVSGVQIGIHQNGELQKSGTIGEIVVNGPNIMLGYYNDPLKTAQVLSEFGLRTGDMGYLDDEGYIYITGRLDNALNVAGHMLYPETIEKVIYSHPDVQEAAIAGVPDEIWGCLPIAYVVPNNPFSNEKDFAQELFSYCWKHLTSFQQPAKVVIVQSLPKRDNGKLDRKQLQSIVEEMEHASNHGRARH